MASRDIPRHRMGPSSPTTGRCLTMVPSGVIGKRQESRCGLLPEDTVHRFYPCRLGCGPDTDFLSVEGRDRHEANAHGGGW